ncbi:MAG: hypothetical protein RR212_05970 [Bacteroidales bacterium]
MTKRLMILLSALLLWHTLPAQTAEKKTEATETIENTATTKKKWFNPDIKIGAGTILQTIFQETHDGGYTFEPAALKVGFLHFDMQVSEKLFTSVSWAFHSGKLSDAFIRYTFNPYLTLQLGRFKGAGTRAGHMTSLYDADFCDFTYTSENLSADLGSGDFRHYGIDVSGRAKFIAYKFTLHNGLSNRTHYFAGTNDGPAQGNSSRAFKNWDGALSFYPFNNFEFGGHIGSRNRPGMGKDAVYAYSAYAYYVRDNKFKLKADFAAYTKPVFEEQPNESDYLSSIYTPAKKLGASFLAGYQLTSRFEPVARYEYFNHGRPEFSGEKYQHLHMYTVGTNFYLFPKEKRKAKISLFYQFRDERGGEKIDNNWLGVSYQVFFMR